MEDIKSIYSPEILYQIEMNINIDFWMLILHYYFL